MKPPKCVKMTDKQILKSVVFLPIKAGNLELYYDWDKEQGCRGQDSIVISKPFGLIVRAKRKEEWKEHIQVFEKYAETEEGYEC